jgi:glycosyltransferase involved in cell wall biosynthesis
MRAAFITTFPPDRGNLAEYGQYLVEATSRDPRIEHIDVLADEIEGAPALERVSDKITIRRVWRLGSARSVEKLVYHARKIGPDIVHLNAGIRTWGQSRLVSLAGAALAAQLRLTGLKVVTTLHHIAETMRFDDTIDTTLKLDPVTKLGMTLASRLYLKANVVVVTLGTMQRLLTEIHKAKNVAHLSHGTFGLRVPRPPEPTKLRVLCFGFWGAFKDADMLVEAVRNSRKRGIDAELVLGGGAHPYFPEIYQSLVRRYQDLEFVRFTGYVPERDLDKLFSSVSLVVLPYRTNSGASGVLNLARSYGRPVAISNDPGLLEQIRYEGGSAMVFRDTSSLEDAIVRILGDRELRTTMGQANLSVAERLTIGSQAHRLVDIFERLHHGAALNLPVSPVVHRGSLRPLDPDPMATLFAFPTPI